MKAYIMTHKLPVLKNMCMECGICIDNLSLSLYYKTECRIISKFKRHGGCRMLDFNKELESFKPMQDVEYTQEELASEELEDIIDVFKSFQKDIKKEKHNRRKEE